MASGGEGRNAATDRCARAGPASFLLIGVSRPAQSNRQSAGLAAGCLFQICINPICPPGMCRPLSTFLPSLLHLLLLLWAYFLLSLLLLVNSVRLPAENRTTLIVLAAPSIWDVNYAADFVPILNFQVRLVKLLNEYESAVLVADKHTLPYLDGRAKLLSEWLSPDTLLEANIYDINIHDFAPLGCQKSTKFIYRSNDLPPIASKQVDDSINRFLVTNRIIKLHKREREVILSGRDVVENGLNRALISSNAMALNAKKQSEWELMLKLQSAFRKVTIVPPPPPFMGRKNLRLDDVLAFVDDGVLVMSAMDTSTKARIHSELWKREKREVMVVELPIGDEERTQQLTEDPYLQDEGNCGIYTAILATDRHVFVPVFGNIPANWKLGYSTKMDKLMLRIIETNTRKRVIPVQIPREICRRGLSMRALTWTVKGSTARMIREMVRARSHPK